MSGLDSSGFTPETFVEIQERIKGKLDIISPGFDFSPESPDGQLINIFSFELSQVWNQLNLVYQSYDPSVATGSALRNLGQISGVPYGTANRSYATIETQGITGVVIPQNSLVTDVNGTDYYVAFDTVIPANAQVISRLAGPQPVPAGSITTIKTSVNGWTGITQTTDGVIGSNAMTDQQYRNFRQDTVMRNYVGTVDTMRGRLLEAGVGQASVYNNDSDSTSLSVPAGHISVTVDDVGVVTDETIATVIFETNAVGVPTFGTTDVVIQDNQGFDHTVSFTKAAAVDIFVKMEIQFLNEESAGAEEAITQAITTYINGLPAGSDVIISHLYQYITPYGDAQVNALYLSKVSQQDLTSNVPISPSEFASMALPVGGVSPGITILVS